MLHDTAQLKVDSTLPVLSFNFKQLKKWALGLTERYTDLVVTEDAIADVKRDMAELNKARKAVDDARKETVRQVTEPIRAFETQIKEVCGIFDTAYTKLGNQVKAFEDAQREEKRKAVFALIEQELESNEITMEIPIQDSWLNKTASMKSVRESVAAIITREIERRRALQAQEQAKCDRAAAIESRVQSLNQQYGLNLSVSSFVVGKFMDMGTPLADVHEWLDTAFKAEAARIERQKQAASCSSPVEHKPACVSKNAESERQAATAQAQTRVMSIVFEYDVAKEAQVKACLENLKNLCARFGARCRE
jgi:Protein of unknown function (DUF1351).